MQRKIPKFTAVPKEPRRIKDNSAVWAEFVDLGIKYKAVSLGQGAPDLSPPKFLKDAVTAAMDSGFNQYCRSFGTPQLMTKVADIYGSAMGRKIDPMKEVVGTLGANGGLHCFINGLLDPGKELVTFEPMFPMYLDHIDLAGGKLRSVPLLINDNKWNFNPDQLYDALSQKDVSVFLFNSPHNPTGKVFTLQEMELISDMLDDFPHIKVISDEVYNFLTFDGAKHHYFATVGNNWERTVSIFSGGKLFNCTGWKVGWAVGPQPLIHLGAIMNSAVYYCFNHPGQVGIANCLDKAFSADFKEVAGEKISYSEDVRRLFESNRDYLDKSLREMKLPFKPLKTEGGYFLIADISECLHLIPERYLKSHDDY